MKKNKHYESQFQEEEQLAAPAKCAESMLTRPDGGIRSPNAAASLLHGESAEADLDFAPGCSLNQAPGKKKK